jgi:hypothetical protein
VTGALFQTDVLRWLLKVLPFLSPKHESFLSKWNVSDHLKERPYSTVQSLSLSECNEHEADVPAACPQGLLLADSVEKVCKFRFSSGRHTGCWACSGKLTLVIGRGSSTREFFNKIGTSEKFGGGQLI